MTIYAIEAFSSESLAAIGAPFANHLWQSTLFAMGAGLLTLMLRKNHARTRCWLWFAASTKFLVPFSLVVGIGSHLGWSKVPPITQPGFFFLVQQIGQPFTSAKPTYVATTALTVAAHPLPTLLLLVWLCGCIAVLFFWWFRWRRLRAFVRGMLPVNSGREIAVLRRVERCSGISKKIELVVSQSALEPGILGFFRPILLLPVGILDRLTDAQLETIIAHELCHVRRCDNLSAAVHMLVEAIFWFHPLVWWIGARLVHERERACDEEVLGLGSDPQVYAESILKVCEFYLESPLFCAAGVTGSNLKKRIEAIMIRRTAHNLGLGKKLFLSAMVALAVVGPVAFGLLHVPQSRAAFHAQYTGPIGPVYEVVSIKPNESGIKPAGRVLGEAIEYGRYSATGISTRVLIREAYEVQDGLISDAPDWLKSEIFDIEAKTNSSVDDELRKLTLDEQLRESHQMLRALLADRFKLTIHRETKELPVYTMVIVRSGPQLQVAKLGDTYPEGIKDLEGNGHGDILRIMGGRIIGQGLPIAALAEQLSQILGRTVLDKTGLINRYDFTLQLPWTPSGSQSAGGTEGDQIVTAVQEQLGLKLELQNTPVEVLVIDHVERPSEN